jgi:hypothetical protein
VITALPKNVLQKVASKIFNTKIDRKSNLSRLWAFLGEDLLLANGVAMAAARRKTGGLQWGDFPSESGAKTHREMMGDCPPSFFGLKNRGEF